MVPADRCGPSSGRESPRRRQTWLCEDGKDKLIELQANNRKQNLVSLRLRSWRRNNLENIVMVNTWEISNKFKWKQRIREDQHNCKYNHPLWFCRASVGCLYSLTIFLSSFLSRLAQLCLCHTTHDTKNKEGRQTWKIKMNWIALKPFQVVSNLAGFSPFMQHSN